MNDTTTKDSPLARLALGLCATWLAAGAYAKLVYGNPLLLPEVIRNHSPISWSLTYTLVIGIEFALVALCFLRPRMAWPLMLALFAFFEFVLTTQIAAGAKSCGCFGDGLEVSPKLMMGVDSALLLALLASKPWISIRSRGAGIGIVLCALILAFAAPAVWIHVRQREEPPKPPSGNGTAATVKSPDWLELHPEKWMGKSVYDIEELTKYVAAEKLPTVSGLPTTHRTDVANLWRGVRLALVEMLSCRICASVALRASSAAPCAWRWANAMFDCPAQK